MPKCHPLHWPSTPLPPRTLSKPLLSDNNVKARTPSASVGPSLGLANSCDPSLTTAGLDCLFVSCDSQTFTGCMAATDHVIIRTRACAADGSSHRTGKASVLITSNVP